MNLQNNNCQRCQDTNACKPRQLIQIQFVAPKLSESSFSRAETDFVSAKVLLERGPSKLTRNQIHELVHQFRAAHGLTEIDDRLKSLIYKTVLAHYGSQLSGVEEADAIKKIGNAKFYEAVRLADNGRVMFDQLSLRGLCFLAREIRAAFVWNHLASKKR